jgi:hypothetical protein
VTGDANTPDTIVAHFGEVCVASAFDTDVANELNYFTLPSVSKLDDTTLAGVSSTFHHVVALQVEFAERHILKPVFHLIGFRLWV